jgi:predicted dienelactone hydrolase
MIVLRLLTVFFCFFFFQQNAWAMGEKATEYMVGFSTIGLSAPGSGQDGEISVWYPSSRYPRPHYNTQIGHWNIRAEINAPPANGVFPVILVSHDMARHGLAHHDLCSALAQAGFVVIAPTHFADNSKGANAIFSAALYYHRPRQLVAALESLSKIKNLRKIINLNEVGLLGSGTGAVTVLQLVGADINPEAYAPYCAETPSDTVFCNKWAYSRLSRLPADMQAIKTRQGKNAFTPGLPNIKAVGMLAPGGFFLLNTNYISELKLPLAVVLAEQDELYKTEFYPLALRQAVRTHVLKGVDHYSVAASCPEEFLATLPEFCGAAPQEIQIKAALERDRFFISFFRAALGPPLEKQP